MSSSSWRIVTNALKSEVWFSETMYSETNEDFWMPIELNIIGLLGPLQDKKPPFCSRPHWCVCHASTSVNWPFNQSSCVLLVSVKTSIQPSKMHTADPHFSGKRSRNLRILKKYLSGVWSCKSRNACSLSQNTWLTISVMLNYTEIMLVWYSNKIITFITWCSPTTKKN